MILGEGFTALATYHGDNNYMLHLNQANIPNNEACTLPEQSCTQVVTSNANG